MTRRYRFQTGGFRRRPLPARDDAAAPESRKPPPPVMAFDIRPDDLVNQPVMAWIRNGLAGDPDLTSRGGEPNFSRLAKRCITECGLESEKLGRADSVRRILRREYLDGCHWPR
jgi:hypothetical protein